MKKAVDFLKRNKSALIVLVLLIALIIIAVALNGNRGLSVSTTGANATAQNKSETEIKLERILSEMEGVGQAEVMINEGADGIEGVIIVCSGANNIMTRNNIINAVTTLLKVKGNNIAIYAMNNQ